jgi:hypothetical protein
MNNREILQLVVNDIDRAIKEWTDDSTINTDKNIICVGGFFYIMTDKKEYRLDNREDLDSTHMLVEFCRVDDMGKTNPVKVLFKFLGGYDRIPYVIQNEFIPIAQANKTMLNFQVYNHDELALTYKLVKENIEKYGYNNAVAFKDSIEELLSRVGFILENWEDMGMLSKHQTLCYENKYGMPVKSTPKNRRIEVENA